MDVLTLYVGQGALAALRSENEALVVDCHMPDCDDVCQAQIEQSLADYIGDRRVRGLILTGLDCDHACPAGVESVLGAHEPDWIMYPTYYKDTDTAAEVFEIVERHVRRRRNTARPLTRQSVRVDQMESRYMADLASHFTFELFSPHMDDMDCSNNSSIVLKVSGSGASGFRYLITGDTETERWDRINRFFGDSLAAEVMAASHHGARTGINATTLLHVSPHTVHISAGVNNQYGHPDGSAVKVYGQVAQRVFATNTEGGVCLFARRLGSDIETRLVRHPDRSAGKRQTSSVHHGI
jgi:beta-lactamase superfamily II metal-dependent hydrolase